MIFERFEAKVVTIDTDKKTALVEGYEWSEEYKYKDEAEHVLVESILNNRQVNVLAEEREKTKCIVKADYLEEGD
jgi:hypothetical protein